MHGPINVKASTIQEIPLNFMEPGVPLSLSQTPNTCPTPETDQFIACP